MSGSISTRSCSFLMLISLSQRDTECVEYQGLSALGFIFVYAEHPTSKYLTRRMDL